MKTGIILANTGTPDTPAAEAVERYLRQFLTHDRIRPMPAPLWGLILELFILPRRKLASAEKYSRIWRPEGSPLSVMQEDLAKKLEDSLREKHQDVMVLSAMSFGNPSLEEAVSVLESSGCEKLVVMPLYPQYAYSNAGIVEDDIRTLASSHPLARDAVFIKDYWESDLYLDGIAESVSKAGFDAEFGDYLVITYHSVPRADIASGDSYDVTTQKTTEAIAKRLGLDPKSYSSCYQSRFDKGRKWLDPFLGPTLDTVASDTEKRRVFVVTPGFAIDCLETLYDIDIVMRERFNATRSSSSGPEGGESFVYVECLNSSPSHVALCESVLSPHLS